MRTPANVGIEPPLHPENRAAATSFRGPQIPRRHFLKLTAAITSAAALTLGAPAAPPAEKDAPGLVDVNVSLGRWPTRRLPDDEPEPMVAKLRACGVNQAWVGSLEGVLHKDLRAVNARLAEDCRRHGNGWLLPFGSINPKLPDWEHDLQECADTHRMAGIRLHPNYHGYRLDDPALTRLLKQAAARRLVVQLALAMEDDRIMHPLLRVEPVDVAPLADLVRQTPGLRLVLLNGLRTMRGPALRQLLAAGDVSFEIAMLEGVGGVGSLLEQVPVERVLFGSHLPFFYFEAAELKLQESSLTTAQRQAITQANAQRLLAWRP